MLIAYDDNSLSFAITGSASGSAFLSDSSQLADGRTGTPTKCQWISGAQTIASYVQITVTIASALDATAVQGAVGICNVSGLPAGTKVQIGAKSQRLVAGSRGELSAWILPFATGNTCTIKIFNDVNGSASIAAGTIFTIGEIFVGRIISLPTLIAGAPPVRMLIDQTVERRSAGAQAWPLYRKPYWQVSAQLGRFTRAQAYGGADSDLPNGGNPAGVIDVQTLLTKLSTIMVCAVCHIPSAWRDQSTLSNGIRFDQDFMQPNWMLARPSNIAQIVEDSGASPFLSWSPTFVEAT